MRTVKKALSVILCLCMIMSVSAVGLNVFAQDKSEAVVNLEAEIKAYTGNVDIAEPSQADLEGYEKLTAGFKALTQDQKDSMDVMVFDILYHHVIDRERRLSIKNNPSLSSYSSQHYANAVAQLTTVLGELPAYVDAAEKLAVKLEDKAVSIDEKKEAWTAADYNTRILAGAYSTSYNMFYNDLNGSELPGLKLIAGKVYDDLLKNDPSPARPGRPGSAPSASDYEQGENDPAYIEAYQKWLEKSEAYYKGYAAQYDHEGKLYLEAIEWAASVEPAYKELAAAIKAVREAKAAYDSEGLTSKAAAAVKLCDEMSESSRKMFDNISNTFYAVGVNQITDWTYETYNAKGLYNACKDIGNARYINYFVVVIEGIDEPYTRDDIDSAKAAYAKVPSSLRNQIPVETMTKYKAILASIGPDEGKGERPNVERMQSTVVKYPFGASKKSVNKMLGKVEDILFTALNVPNGDASQLMSTGVYTNYTVAEIAKVLFPLLGQASSLISKGPADLAKKLDADKCAGAIEALNAASNTVDADGNKVSKVDAWQYLTVVDGDFGFLDGDKEGFLDAVASLFRPLTLMTLVITLENKVDTGDGTYTYGAYEDLVPVFEALGATGFMSSDEYTNYVNAGATGEEKMERRIRAILVPVFNLMDSVAADESPLNALLGLLTKVAYVVDSGELNTQIQALISKLKLGLASKINVDLTTEGLYDMIAPKLENIELQAAKVDENGEEIAPAVTLSLNLDKDKFVSAIKDLAGCGVYTANESIARGKNWFVSIDGDAADAFVVLFRYLHSELTAENNATAIKAAVKALDMNFAQRIAVNFLVSVVLSSSADGALRTLVFMVPVVKAGVKIASWFGAFKK